MGSTKEAFLEKKLKLLEQRVTRVERLLESRFCDYVRRQGDSDPHGIVSQDAGLEQRTDQTPSSSDSFRSRRSLQTDGTSPDGATYSFDSSTNQKLTTEGPRELKVRLRDLRVLIPRIDGDKDKSKNASSTATVETSNVGRTTRSRSKQRNPVILENGKKRKLSEERSRNLEPRNNEPEPATSNNQQSSTSSDRDEGEHEDMITDQDDYDEYFSYSTVETKPDVESVENVTSVDEMDTGNTSDHSFLGGDDDHIHSSSDEDFSEKKKTSKKKTTKPKSSRKSPKKPVEKKPRKGPMPKSEYKWRQYNSKNMKPPSLAKAIVVDPLREQCPVCHVYFKKEFFQQHVIVHSKERTLQCPDCDKAFFSLNGLYKHKQQHNRDKYATNCRICGKELLKRKMLAHERYCVRVTLTRGEEVDPEVMNDIRKRSMGKELNWPEPGEDLDVNVECSTCKKVMKKRFIARHMKSHTVVTPSWKCGICEKIYCQKHNLIRHMCIEHGNAAADADAETSSPENSGKEATMNLDKANGENELSQSSANVEESVLPDTDTVDVEK